MMIDYHPDAKYFNWAVDKNIKSEHWQQVLTITPYAEIITFLNTNPAILLIIQQGLYNANNGND